MLVILIIVIWQSASISAFLHFHFLVHLYLSVKRILLVVTMRGSWYSARYISPFYYLFCIAWSQTRRTVSNDAHITRRLAVVLHQEVVSISYFCNIRNECGSQFTADSKHCNQRPEMNSRRYICSCTGGNIRTA